MKVYKVRAKVWLYPIETSAWHFVYVSERVSKEIKSLQKQRKRRGFGSVPVMVTVGKNVWKTSIFPSKEGAYLLPLKSAIRTQEGIFDGDTISFSLRILPS